MPDLSGPEEFVSIGEFMKRSSLSRATVYNLIERGELPKPIRLTPNRVALSAPSVRAWFASKLEAA